MIGGYFSKKHFFSDIIEEEEAFQAYAEQRRYASTLGRACLGSGGSATGTGTRTRRDTADGKSDSEKIRNLKGNISRLVRPYLLIFIIKSNQYCLALEEVIPSKV